MSTLALGLGVVVAGLGIGALLAAFHQRAADRSTLARAGATASPVLPTLAPTLAPPPPAAPAPRSARSATPAAVPATPQGTPRPAATPSVVPSPTAAPSATPEPTATPTLKPTAPPAATPSPRPTTRPTPVPAPTPVPQAVARRTPPPAPPTSAPSAAPPSPLPSAAPVTPVPVAPSGASRAASVVRRYLDAVAHGDERSAFAALGGSPGDRGLSLKEQAILDPASHITSIRSTLIDPANATVECEISATTGSYYMTFHVTTGPSGPYITDHDYIKV